MNYLNTNGQATIVGQANKAPTLIFGVVIWLFLCSVSSAWAQTRSPYFFRQGFRFRFRL